MQTNKRLLIVDDDKQIRELLTFDIEQSGYVVDSATDGEEGLKKALENNYDLILLDVMMPKMNGYDVCKNIRIQNPTVPILMLTAKGAIEDKTQGFDCGADDYLSFVGNADTIIGYNDPLAHAAEYHPMAFGWEK